LGSESAKGIDHLGGLTLPTLGVSHPQGLGGLTLVHIKSFIKFIIIGEGKSASKRSGKRHG